MCNIHETPFLCGHTKTVTGSCDFRNEGMTDLRGTKHVCQRVVAPLKDGYHECASDCGSEGCQGRDETMKIIVRNEAYLRRRPTRSGRFSTAAISFEYPGEIAIKHQYCVNGEFLARRDKRRQIRLHLLGQQRGCQMYVKASRAHELAVLELEKSALAQEVPHLRTSGNIADTCPLWGSRCDEDFCQLLSREIGCREFSDLDLAETRCEDESQFHTTSQKSDDQLETQSITTETSDISTTSQDKTTDTTDSSSPSPETVLDDCGVESLALEDKRKEEPKQQKYLFPLDSEGGRAILAEIKEYLSLPAESTPAEVFALQNRIPGLFEGIQRGELPLRPRLRVPAKRSDWERDMGLQRLTRVSDERWTINSEFVRAWDTLRWTDLWNICPPFQVPRHESDVIRKIDAAFTREVQAEIKSESESLGTLWANRHQPKDPSRLRITSTCDEPRSISEVPPEDPSKLQTIATCDEPRFIPEVSPVSLDEELVASYLDVDDFREVRPATCSEDSQSITSYWQEPLEYVAQIEETQYEPSEYDAQIQETQYEPPEYIAQTQETQYEPPEYVAQIEEAQYKPPGSVAQIQEAQYEPPGCFAQIQENWYEPSGSVVQIQENWYEPPPSEGYSEEAALNVIRELLSIPASRSGQEISQILDRKRKYSGWEESSRLIDIIRMGYVPRQIDRYGIILTCMTRVEQFQAQAELSRAIDAVDWEEIDSLPIPLDPSWLSPASKTGDSLNTDSGDGDGDGDSDDDNDEYIKLTTHVKYAEDPRFSKFRAKVQSNLRYSLTYEYD